MEVRVFKAWSTKLEKILPKNQNTQRKLLNFENWTNGEVSKTEHHFSYNVEHLYFGQKTNTFQTISLEK